MRPTRVPILNEEYAVHVLIGPRRDICLAAAPYLQKSAADVAMEFFGCRGRVYNRFPEESPLVLVDSGLPTAVAFATLAHEASHALDLIAGHIHLYSGEFRAHGIAAVLRAIGPRILARRRGRR